MKTRLDLLERLPKASIGAELGVFRGDFSSEIVSRVDPKHLFLVDIFDGMMQSGDRNGEHFFTIDMTDQFEIVKARFALNREISVVKAHSWAWLDAMPENSLDWVYIDTDHSLSTTENELRASRRAVRPGGIISGHDYDKQNFPGVIYAVDKFIEQHGLTGELTSEDKLASYWIVNTK